MTGILLCALQGQLCMGKASELCVLVHVMKALIQALDALCWTYGPSGEALLAGGLQFTQAGQVNQASEL